MIAVTYTIELLEPLLATALDGDPNTKVSHDFIPGSMIRGALIHLYLQGRRRQPFAADNAPKALALDHSDETEHRLFLGNTTRYLNAYPLVYPPAEAEAEERRYRLLPLPPSFQIIKGDDLEGENISLYNTVSLLAQRPQKQLTGVNKAFYLPLAEIVYVHSPDRQIAVHTARERKLGRATATDGAVFQYDALTPGQTFGGHILVSAADDADTLVNLLNQAGELWLGGSRSAGYGHVRVSAYCDLDWQNEVASFVQAWSTSTTDDDNDERNGYGDDDEDDGLIDMNDGDVGTGETDSAERNGNLQAGEQFTITCLSHCLVRNEHGQAAKDIRHALAVALHIPVAALQLDLAHTHRTMTVVGGFNRTWGLPLPQIPAIAAGSIFTFRTEQEIDAKAIQALIDEGIGELRSDGLGRMAVNWLPKATYKIKLLNAISKPGKAPAIYPNNRAFAQRIGERILRRELDGKLVNAVAKLPLYKASLDSISKSQLARLRTLLREQLGWWQQQPLDQLTEEEAENLIVPCFNPLLAYLNQLKRPAQKQWHAAKIGQTGQTRLAFWLRQQIETCLNREKRDWPADLAIPQEVKLGLMTIPVPAIWRVEYTLRLIDGVLAQAAKQIERKKHKATGVDQEDMEEEVIA